MSKNTTDHDETAQLGRNLAADYLGRELAAEYLKPEQQERARKRAADLDGTNTPAPSPEARRGELSASDLGRDFALDHLTPEQRERAERIKQRRDAAGE